MPFRRNRLPLAAALYLKDLDYDDAQIAADLAEGAVREALVRNRPPVRTPDEFNRRLKNDRSAVIRAQAEMTAILGESLAAAAAVASSLEDARVPVDAADAVTAQLGWLVFRGFPRVVPLATLRHYRRYLKGAAIRVERARLNPSGDRTKEAKFAPYWACYREAVRAPRPGFAATREAFRWAIEEYRISLFAQELHTPEPISPKRLDALAERLARK